MSDTISVLKKEIEEKQKQINELERTQKILYKGDRYALADVLHAKFCHFNHIDQCDYYYFSWDNFHQNSCKRIWKDKAEIVLKLFHENLSDVPIENVIRTFVRILDAI